MLLALLPPHTTPVPGCAFVCNTGAQVESALAKSADTQQYLEDPAKLAAVVELHEEADWVSTQLLSLISLQSLITLLRSQATRGKGAQQDWLKEVCMQYTEPDCKLLVGAELMGAFSRYL